MNAVAGYSANVLDPAIDAAAAAAIKRSPCKVLLSRPDGSHAEMSLPQCDGVPRFQATHCHMHLERICEDLRRVLVPACLAGLAIDRVNAYISPAGAGTTLHFDSRTVIIVQLAGEKLWEVSEASAVQAPHANCLAPPNSEWVDYGSERLRVPPASELVAHALAPGDWLLIPKAMWHQTKTTVGSVSATLAFPE